MLPHDFDLQASHLPALSKRDAVVTVLELLGYDNEARLPLTLVALNWWKSAHQTYTTSEDVVDLFVSLKCDFGSGQAEFKPQPPAPSLAAEHLHLACWEYVWS